MKTYIALLRGVNVTGHNKIKMADLKVAFEKNGFKDVTTYIQSGNVIFKSSDKPVNELENEIYELLQKTFSLDVETMVLTPEDLKNAVEESPYKPGAEIDENRIYFMFLKSKPQQDAIQKLSEVPLKDEFYVLKDRLLSAHLPNGFGKAKLTTNFIESKLKVAATARNWKTVDKLLLLAGSGL
ncbi:DUF1697 domain-containing protein [Saccharicrinis sp. FJH54]|uniref:DUF1697 domain-containing protein n=1 Tax=Saccharicrinis sp. FJH54 TaxID=3344665 RepID=UPI0035D4B1CD